MVSFLSVSEDESNDVMSVASCSIVDTVQIANGFGLLYLDLAILAKSPFLFHSFGSRMQARSDSGKNLGLKDMGPTQ